MPQKIFKNDSNRVTIKIWKRDTLLPFITMFPANSCGHVSLKTYGDDGFYASLWPDDEDKNSSKKNKKTESLGKDKKKQFFFGVPSKNNTEEKDEFDEGIHLDMNYNELISKYPGIKIEKPDDCNFIVEHGLKNRKKLKKKEEEGETIKVDNETVVTKIEGKDKYRITKTRKPIEVNLYSLDVKKIKKAYQEYIKNPNKKWCGLGSSIFQGNTQNCCGFVAYLLEAGGIEKLVTTYKNPLTSFLSYFGGGAISGAGAMALGTILTIGTGGAALPVIAGIGAIGGGVIGLAVNQTDIVEGCKVAITPDGIGTLVKIAEAKEKEKYQLVDDDEKEEKNEKDLKIINN